MKAIATVHSSLFFTTASAGPLTGPWNAPFLARVRSREATTANRTAARRQLREAGTEGSLWQESAARAALALAIVSAYATAIWQIGSF